MDEVQRVHRVARRDIVSLPTFLADVDKYRKQLRQIAVINGLDPHCAQSLAKSLTVTLDVELAIPKPARNRHRIKPKPTVTRIPRQSTYAKRVNRAVPVPLPAVTGNEAENDKAENVCGEDRLRLIGLGSATQAAKRLARLQKQCERSAFVDGVQTFKVFKMPMNLDNFLNRRQF